MQRVSQARARREQQSSKVQARYTEARLCAWPPAIGGGGSGRGRSRIHSHIHGVHTFWRYKVARPCRTCRKSIEDPIANQQYCGVECKPSYRLGPAKQLRRYEADPDYVYAGQARWRKYVAEAHGYACADCGKEGQSFHAHHIIPRSAGGKNTVKNGTYLCPDCHKARHNGASSEADLVERIARRVVDLVREERITVGDRPDLEPKNYGVLTTDHTSPWWYTFQPPV